MFSALSLKYFGESLSPSLITASLEVEPTSFSKTGDVIISKTGKSRVVKNGTWTWSLKEDSEGCIIKQLGDQVEEFYSVFSKVYEKLNAQQNCLYSWIDIHIINDEGSTTSFQISNESMQKLVKTGLMIEFTIE